MKVSAHTMGSPELTAYEAADLFSSMGYEGIEYVSQEGYRCGPYVDWSESERTRLKEYCAAKNLPIVCLTPYVTDLNSRDEARAEEQIRLLKDSILLARDIGAPILRMYGGRQVPPDEWQESTRITAERLRSMSDLCGQTGVKLAVENHYGTITTTVAETMALVRAANTPAVGILYDQANITHAEGENYQEAVRLQAGHILHVHVKDLARIPGRTHTTDFSQVTNVPKDKRAFRSILIGQGMIPWRDIIPALREIGYDGYLSVEYARKWYPEDLPEPEIGMKHFVDYLKNLPLAG